MLDNITDWFVSKRKIFRKVFVVILTLIEISFFLIGVQSAEPRYHNGEVVLPAFSEEVDVTSSPLPVLENTSLPEPEVTTPIAFENLKTPVPKATASPNTSPDIGIAPEHTTTPKPENTPEPTSKPNIIDMDSLEVPIYWGDRDKNAVFFTFDDGYDKEALSITLDTLKEKNIKCTFFVVGDYLEYFPDLWKRVIDEGHYLCNHTDSHRILTSLSEEEIRKEITGWEDTISKIIGDEYLIKMKKEFPFFRMPGGGGHNDKKILEILSEYGYIPVGWSLETYNSIIKHHNTEQEPIEPIIDKIVNHVVKNSQNGIIILLHINYLDTPKLDEMLDGVIEKGLTIENLDSLLISK